MSCFTRALLAALGGISVLVFKFDLSAGRASLPLAHADAPPNASDCMNFQNEEQGKTIMVHASNACERKLSCSMSFVVRCQDNHEKTTASTQRSSRFALPAHGSTNIELSAEHCPQGWRIDDVSWSCS